MTRSAAIPMLCATLAACAEADLIESHPDDAGPLEALASDGGATTTPSLRPADPVPVTPMEVHDARRGPPYPLVLVHGLNGFRDLGPVDYFFRVPEKLAEAGHDVHVTAVAPYDSSERRAALLAPQVDAILERTGAARVNIIAHSQGGLDARYLVSTMGYGDRVASITTISTPHRGTRVADVIKSGESPVLLDLINGWASLFGDVARDAENNPDAAAALATLTTDGLVAFNAANVDDPRVAYYSFAGRSGLQRADDQCQGEWPNPGAVDALEPALVATWTLLAENVLDPVANDGLVPVSSARWGRFMGCLPADHADEIGQLADLWPELISGWDHREFYADWARFLRAQGH